MVNWIGIIHVVSACLFSIYAFLFKRNRFDYVYLCVIYFLLLHWTFLNGECFLSYMIKKGKNPEYIAGQETGKNEMIELFKGNKYLINLFRFIINVVWTVSLYLVLVRNKFSPLYYVPFVLLFGSYKAITIYSIKFDKQNTFYIIQDIIKYSLLLYGLFFLRLLLKRFRSKK